MSRINAKPKLSILTDCVPIGDRFFSENLKIFLRYFRDKIIPHKQNYNRSKYRGHPAVTRSLIEGLISIDASFNYNPKTIREIGNSVVVLSGIETLRQMILFKRKGIITTLFAGPNIVVFSSDYDSILASPEIDYIITPSKFVVDIYLKDCPTLEGRCFSWPAGVNTEYWKPNPLNERKQILIFDKLSHIPSDPIKPYQDYLENLGFEIVRLKYGNFTHSQYLHYLQQSCLMVGFSMSESQGLAWAECWSVDVPTLLLKNTNNVYCGKSYHCSTAPYLCDQNGLFFNDLSDFKKKLDFWKTHQETFLPREWSLENMSDKVCASNLYNKITKC